MVQNVKEARAFLKWAKPLMEFGEAIVAANRMEQDLQAIAQNHLAAVEERDAIMAAAEAAAQDLDEKSREAEKIEARCQAALDKAKAEAAHILEAADAEAAKIVDAAQAQAVQELEAAMEAAAEASEVREAEERALAELSAKYEVMKSEMAALMARLTASEEETNG